MVGQQGRRLPAGSWNNRPQPSPKLSTCSHGVGTPRQAFANPSTNEQEPQAKQGRLLKKRLGECPRYHSVCRSPEVLHRWQPEAVHKYWAFTKARKTRLSQMSMARLSVDVNLTAPAVRQIVACSSMDSRRHDGVLVHSTFRGLRLHGFVLRRPCQTIFIAGSLSAKICSRLSSRVFQSQTSSGGLVDVGEWSKPSATPSISKTTVYTVDAYCDERFSDC